MNYKKHKKHTRSKPTRRNRRRNRGGSTLSTMAVPAGLLLLQRALSSKVQGHKKSKKRSRSYRKK